MAGASAETVEVSAGARIESALDDLRAGRFVLVRDDPERGAQGSVVVAAQFATPDAVNFMARDARGLISLALTPERCDELRLPQMARRGQPQGGAAFTVSIEAREGVTTGISAADRSRTIQVAIDPLSEPGDLVKPGHIFPLRARPGGVLERAAITEAGVDLARLAGLNPSAAACQVMNEEGLLADDSDLDEFCERHGIRSIAISDVIEHRRRTERLVERASTVRMPTDYGDFTAIGFREVLTNKMHIALVRGEVDGYDDVLVRVHSECLTGDVFGSHRCDCGQQLDAALRRIAAEDRGVVLYMVQEGRGLGLGNKLRAYEAEDTGGAQDEADLGLRFTADARDYCIGAQILNELGLTTLRVLSDNPRKISALEAFGVTVVEQVPIDAPRSADTDARIARRGRASGRQHHQDLRFVESQTDLPW